MRMWNLLTPAALVCTLSLGPGCNGPLSPEAKKLLLAGYDAYERGEDKAAIARMDEFLLAAGRSNRADEAYYLRGLAKYRSGDLDGAEADMQLALTNVSHKEVRGKARLALGDLAWGRGHLAEAEELYRSALEDIPQGRAPGDQAHYKLGCALQRLGRWEDASVQFHRVLDLFEGTKWARLAGQRANAGAWTIQVGAFDGKKRADEHAVAMMRKGLPAAVRPVLRQGKLVFLVQAGIYSSYDQAAEALSKAKKTQQDAYIATR